MTPLPPNGLKAALEAPFPRSRVRCLPRIVKDRRALVSWYLDHDTISERLDDVFGPLGWGMEIREAVDRKVVICILTVLRVNADGSVTWVPKSDMGGESKQPDEGERHLAAVTKAFKRAARHLGIGRYLRDIPATWHDYDPQRKQFVSPPTLPEKFLPASERGHAPHSAPKAAPELPPGPPQTAKADAPNHSEIDPQKSRELAGEFVRLYQAVCDKFDLANVDRRGMADRHKILPQDSEPITKARTEAAHRVAVLSDVAASH